jgi:hypothetical protein
LRAKIKATFATMAAVVKRVVMTKHLNTDVFLVSAFKFKFSTFSEAEAPE